ncbi:MAG: hypothetical protein JJU02_14115 [Cryomorphaceae bacterium]|nr:hypothetical protein [Cryomorphaceae bacterium]
MKVLKIFSAFIGLIALTSCAARLTPEIIEEHGTRVFEADKKSVYEAVKLTLASKNYVIDIDKYEEGYLKTKQKMISTSGAATSTTTAVYQNNYRLYIVDIKEVSPGNTKVVLTPNIYIGEVNASHRKIWAIKGGAGEIVLWEALFQDIQERL